MSVGERMMTSTNGQETLSSAPHSRLLHPKCACGGSSGMGTECDECRSKGLGLQRRPASHGRAPAIPASVGQVLRSAGRPLDQSTRAFMEPRFGHDFSRVRIHTDGLARASAKAVEALAYTVGHHVVFGEGQYAPSVAAGRNLLAHELRHVMQQGDDPWQDPLGIAAQDDWPEQDAEIAATSVARGDWVSRPPAPPSLLQHRAPIHTGNILDEGTGEYLACNSKWACPNDGGIECPAGTRNDFSKPKQKFTPLMACDLTCDNAQPCSGSENWMAISKSRYKNKKCGQNLVICANGNFTHATVRDKSEREHGK